MPQHALVIALQAAQAIGRGLANAAAEAIAGCAAESNIKLLALRQLLEQPLHGPAPSTLGSQERQLLNLMDGLL